MTTIEEVKRKRTSELLGLDDISLTERRVIDVDKFAMPMDMDRKPSEMPIGIVGFEEKRAGRRKKVRKRR